MTDLEEWRAATDDPAMTETEARALDAVHGNPWSDWTAAQALAVYRAGVAAR